MSERTAQERKALKASIDELESRRRRQDTTLTIRKNKRLESVMKRRTTDTPPSSPVSGGTKSEGSFEAFAKEEIPAAHSSGPVLFRPELLPAMTQAVMKGNQEQALAATRQFREILSIENHPPINPVIETGIIPRLVAFLKFNGNPTLQFEAAWALTNIASGNSAQTRVVVDAGTVPVWIALIKSPNAEVREQSVWGLGNVAGDSPALRDLCISLGIVKPLLEAIEGTKSMRMLRNATWTLSNLSRGNPPTDFEHLRPILPTLGRLLHCPDVEVLTDACWAFSYISESKRKSHATNAISEIIATGVVDRLVELLDHESLDVQVPALRTVGNIATGTDVQTNKILDSGCLKFLTNMLHSPKKAIQKEAAWTISNITAGNIEQIQRVIESGTMPALIHVIFSAEFPIRREAAWAVSNAISGGTHKQAAQLANVPRMIEALCAMLNCQDGKLLLVIMEALQKILNIGKDQMDKSGLAHNPYALMVQKAKGTDALERLQELQDSSVYKKAMYIAETFFELEGNDEDFDHNLQPHASSESFAVGVSDHSMASWDW